MKSHILVVNSGSSSLKLSLFDSEADRRLLNAHFSGIDSPKASLDIRGEAASVRREFPGPVPLKDALELSLAMMTTQLGVQVSPRTIGHRVVHGGERYRASVVVDDAVLVYLESMSYLAPLHNPHCLEGIRACEKLFGETVPQVAVFDTAFHRSMPQQASQYGINMDLAGRLGIQRYGFHGISHHYLWNSYQRHSIRATDASRIITLHLGNGCSVCAIDGGKSIDTSMGFTPAEGLLMATRAGDIDAGVVEFLCDREKMSVAQVLQMLNERSGLLGVSGLTSDMKELLKVEKKHDRARLAIDIFCYRILKYIGAYIAALGGIDAIIFAGGIGENAPSLRQRILAPLAWCGATIDSDANEASQGMQPGDLRRISTSEAFTEVYVIGTDENAFIAEEAKKKNG